MQESDKKTESIKWVPMTEEKTGFFKRVFSFIGKFLTFVRHTISFVILIFFVSILVGSFAKDKQAIPQSGALVFAPSGSLVDQKTYVDPLSQIIGQGNQINGETLVRDAVAAIDYAADDKRITHLIIDINNLGNAGLSKLQEIGYSIDKFREKKPVIAIGDSFSQSQYYLAAHANEIIMHPFGGAEITGLSSYRNYFKDALSKLKIKVNVFRVGEYKSAVEPFMDNAMSPQVKKETRDLLNLLWNQYSKKIEELRSLELGTITKYASNLDVYLSKFNGDSGKLALDMRLVDHLFTRPEANKYLNKKIGVENDEFDKIDAMTYLENRRVLERTSTNIRNKIGVIVASGTIMDGSQPEGTIGGDTLAKMFTDLKDDENIAAVVLRIDSGGGSAFASEIIRESIISFRETDVPIIISMSSVAASGGYWISADADKIFAMPATITGSIGVWGMIPTIDESLANLGVYSDGVGTSDISGMYQIDRPMTERSKKLFQSGVESIYEKFIELVSNGRGLDQFSTQTIAQGKIWTGTQAINNGLVDQLGGLSQAIEEAANMAGLDDYQVKYFRKTLSPLEMIFLELNAEIRSLFSDHKADRFNNLALRNVQFSLKKNISMFNHLNDPNGEYLLCTLCGTID